MDRIQCPICFANFSNENKPMIMCVNGHSICESCCQDPRSSPSNLCSMCRQIILPTPILNRDVLTLINSIYDTMAKIPMIRIEELKIEEKPFGFGGTADIFRAEWNRQTVAIKRLRTGITDEKQIGQLKAEISIHVGLRHPCIVSLFGYTSNGDGREIVMEYAPKGSLNKNWKGTNQSQLFSWGMDIVAGLEYLHSRKISHR